MRTQGSNNTVLRRATGQRRAGDAAFSQHDHLGLGSERVFGEMGSSQAGCGPCLPGGGGGGAGVEMWGWWVHMEEVDSHCRP